MRSALAFRRVAVYSGAGIRAAVDCLGGKCGVAHFDVTGC